MTLAKLLNLLVALIFLCGAVGVAVAQTQPPPAKQPDAAKPASKAKSATGKVKTVAADSLSIESGKKELTFAVSGMVAEAAKKLKAGDTVTVAYTESGGTMTATKVTPKAAKKASPPCAAK